MDVDDFNCITKLKRSRKVSPIKRLLQDVDICLASFFECIEREQQNNKMQNGNKEEPSSVSGTESEESGGEQRQ